VNGSPRQPEPPAANALAHLPYFLEWRPWLWGPAVRWLLGDGTQFRGKRVLEPGCRSGRMTCLFGLLGAEVLGVDLPDVPLDGARREAERWGVSDRVRFLNYRGDPGTLPEGEFDFVFTKSVFVQVREREAFLTALASRLTAGGELLAAENVAMGPVLNYLRRAVIHRGREFVKRSHGVDPAFLAAVRGAFDRVEYRSFFWLVTAIRARRPRAPLAVTSREDPSSRSAPRAPGAEENSAVQAS
jgi:SAM-dependent methyltransferase